MVVLVGQGQEQVLVRLEGGTVFRIGTGFAFGGPGAPGGPGGPGATGGSVECTFTGDLDIHEGP